MLCFLQTLQWLLQTGQVTVPTLMSPRAFSPTRPSTSSGKKQILKPIKGPPPKTLKVTSGLSKTSPKLTCHPTTRGSPSCASSTRHDPPKKSSTYTRTLIPRPLPLPTSTAGASTSRRASGSYSSQKTSSKKSYIRPITAQPKNPSTIRTRRSRSLDKVR